MLSLHAKTKRLTDYETESTANIWTPIDVLWLMGYFGAR
jgi:hypothetical protein